MNSAMKRLAALVAKRPLASAGLASGVVLGGMAVFNRLAADRAEQRHPPAGQLALVDGVPVHYLEGGTGRTIVLLHGNGAMAEDFVISGLFDRLAQNYHVIAPDRPGFGYTGRPRDRLWTAKAQADLVRGLLDQLGLRNPIILGHSWGTLVAISLALETDALLRGLVLLSGYYYPTRRADVVALSGPALPVVGDVMRYTVSPLLGRAMAPAMFRHIFAPAPVPSRFKRAFPADLALRPEQIRASAEDTALMVPEAARLCEGYPDLRLPVAIMAGSGDLVVDPEEHAERLRTDVIGSALRILPGIGHMIHYAAPDQIAETVRRMAPP
jgi:pimeloyl-ACP methyl ester carboxylesterase